MAFFVEVSRAGLAQRLSTLFPSRHCCHGANQALAPGADVERLNRLYFCGGGGEKISRLRPGSGFGFGLGAFLTSFLPLSLFPMYASMTQKVCG